MSLFNVFKKEQEKFPKMVVLYVSAERNTILIAPQYVDESWLRYEQEEIDILDFNCTDDVLGAAIKRNFNKFAQKNMENKKRTSKDWPAYQATKLKSMKAFEETYFRISITGANEANIIMIFEADMKSKHEINLTSAISAFAENEELGRLTKKLHDIQLNRIVE